MPFEVEKNPTTTNNTRFSALSSKYTFFFFILVIVHIFFFCTFICSLPVKITTKMPAVQIVVSPFTSVRLAKKNKRKKKREKEKKKLKWTFKE